MVSVGIGAVGPSEESGDVSLALSEALSRGAVCSSPPGLCTIRWAHPCDAFRQENSLLCFHLLIPSD